MKKPILLAFLSIGLALTSCSKDDDDAQNQLEGMWKLQAQSYSGEAEELDDCEKKSTVEFKGDNTVVITDIYSSNEECKTDASSNTCEVLASNKLNIKDDSGFSFTFDYTISGS